MDQQTMDWLRRTFGADLPIYREGVKWEDLQLRLDKRPDGGEIEWLIWHTYQGAAWVCFPEAVLEQVFAEMVPAPQHTRRNPKLRPIRPRKDPS